MYYDCNVVILRLSVLLGLGLQLQQKVIKVVKLCYSGGK